MIDIASRVYNHNWKIDPIVRSLLDIDFYKLLMAQFVLRNSPEVIVEFSVINRTNKVALTNLSIFMPFWNHNGIILSAWRFQPENACMSFGLQNGSNFKYEFRNEKYAPWVFQNRPGNIASTSRTIFRSL